MGPEDTRLMAREVRCARVLDFLASAVVQAWSAQAHSQRAGPRGAGPVATRPASARRPLPRSARGPRRRRPDRRRSPRPAAVGGAGHAVRVWDRARALRSGGARMDDAVRVQLFGALSVRVGEVVVPEGAWRLRKAKSVVKPLALAPERRVHR